MQYKDYYETLGVTKNATDADIKKAYREMAKKYHPDQNRGDKSAEQRFKDINEAYEVLKDKEKRARYDQLGSSYKEWEQRGGSSADYNWSDWYSAQQVGSQGGQRQQYYTTGDFGDFSDFFSQIFGGMGGMSGMGGSRRTRTGYGRQGYSAGTQSRMRQQVPAQQYEVPISLDEAYSGTTRRFQVDQNQIEAKIPAGAKDGTKIRLAGVLNSNGAGSDLILVVKVDKDRRFTRKGDDLYLDAHVDLYTAVLGGEAVVQTMNERLAVKVPAGTQPDTLIRLPGKGMPKLKKPEEHGDLFVRIRVSVPKNLNEKQQELFTELKNS